MQKWKQLVNKGSLNQDQKARPVNKTILSLIVVDVDVALITLW